MSTMTDSVIRKLNNIRAALSYARKLYLILQNFIIPKYLLGKEATRDRVRILDEKEIPVLAASLESKKNGATHMIFFALLQDRADALTKLPRL